MKRLLTATLLIVTAVALSSLFPSDRAFGGISFIGSTEIPRTDKGAPTLVNFWDLRGGRTSRVQITNPTATPQRIHVQVFNASDDGCPEFDFFDELTPFDTHVYDLSSLARNNGAPLAPPDLSGGHGILTVLAVKDDGTFDQDAVLTGNFSVDDPAGYRYRTNSAGVFTPGAVTAPATLYFNFSDLGDNASSDVVLIPVVRDGNAVIPLPTILNVTLYDADENPVSCPDLMAGCPFFPVPFETSIDFGVNQLIGNSQGGPPVCLGSDSTGFVELSFPPDGSFGEDIAVVGFVGLNNNGDLGSMDSIYVVLPLF